MNGPCRDYINFIGFVGGTLLTISGSGFATDAVVQVGGVDCPVQDSQPGQVTCLTAQSVSITWVDIK